jgi:hypothetical protein
MSDKKITDEGDAYNFIMALINKDEVKVKELKEKWAKRLADEELQKAIKNN